MDELDDSHISHMKNILNSKRITISWPSILKNVASHKYILQKGKSWSKANSETVRYSFYQKFTQILLACFCHFIALQILPRLVMKWRTSCVSHSSNLLI